MHVKRNPLVLFAVALAVTLSAHALHECRLTFSGYEGKETLTDFPALVKIPDGVTGFDYRDSAADGSDIAFFGADGKRLAHEIDTWNPDGDSYVLEPGRGFICVGARAGTDEGNDDHGAVGRVLCEDVHVFATHGLERRLSRRVALLEVQEGRDEGFQVRA